jgi:hypothetical protein
MVEFPGSLPRARCCTVELPVLLRGWVSGMVSVALSSPQRSVSIAEWNQPFPNVRKEESGVNYGDARPPLAAVVFVWRNHRILSSIENKERATAPENPKPDRI